MPPPGRVLQLLGPSTGGIRVHVGELTRRLVADGWTVGVAGPAGVMDVIGWQDSVVEVPTRWHPRAWRNARRQLRALFDTAGQDASPSPEPVDVVHVHGIRAGLVATSLRNRPPLVLTLHNLAAGTRSGVRARVAGRIERRVIARVDHVIVISDEIGRSVDGLVNRQQQTFVLPVSPLRTVAIPADQVRRSYGIDSGAPLVVVVARLHPQKDLSMFLRAFARVHDVIPAARAVIVGDGPQRSALTAERDALGLVEVVTFAGFRPNPVDEMNAADVVALSSRWEGSPLAVAECLSIGTPLVATAVGGVVGQLTDGVEARVVAIGDDQAFATAITHLLTHPEQARQMGRAGHALGAERFDPDRSTRAVEAVYQAVRRR